MLSLSGKIAKGLTEMVSCSGSYSRASKMFLQRNRGIVCAAGAPRSDKEQGNPASGNYTAIIHNSRTGCVSDNVHYLYDVTWLGIYTRQGGASINL